MRIISKNFIFGLLFVYDMKGLYMLNKLSDKIIIPMNKFAEEHDNLIWLCNISLSIIAITISVITLLTK